MRTRVCGRCGGIFERTRRDLNVWCPGCDRTTTDSELWALIFTDRSGIYSLHETLAGARDAMKQDAMSGGGDRLLLRDVVGQAGARAELSEQRDDEMDHREQGQSRADFERSQEMYR